MNQLYPQPPPASAPWGWEAPDVVPERDSASTAAGTGRGLRARLARLNLRTRVSVLAALGVGLAVALTSVAAFVTVRAQLHQQLDATLLQRAHAAVSSPLSNPSRLVEVPAAALGAADVRIVLVRADGTAFYARGQAQAPPLGPPELAVARGVAEQSVRTVTAGGQEFRVVTVPARRGLALVLAQSTAQTEATLTRLGLVLLTVGAAGVAVAAYAGLVIARAGLRPVDRLTAAAEHVARTGELRPLPVESKPSDRPGEDELARLAHTFNAMLAALGESRDRQRRLVADAGHELRTPLTSLRTNLDLLVQSDHRGGMPPEDRAELLSDARGQAEELTGLVSDLVELAREDTPAATDEPIDLAAMVEEAVGRVRRRAPQVHFDVATEPWAVYGDAQALTRAVTNLLDNAAKWSPASETVTVRLRQGVVTVADQGPGIAPADLPYVFERFYRSSEARGMPGSGLGLAIVRQAAERHGGRVSAQPGPYGGTQFTLEVPGSSSASLG